MKNSPIHVCWIDRIIRDLKLPDQSTIETADLVNNPKPERDEPKRKCFDNFQSLKAENIPKVSSL